MTDKRSKTHSLLLPVRCGVDAGLAVPRFMVSSDAQLWSLSRAWFAFLYCRCGRRILRIESVHWSDTANGLLQMFSAGGWRSTKSRIT